MQGNILNNSLKWMMCNKNIFLKTLAFYCEEKIAMRFVENVWFKYMVVYLCPKINSFLGK
jgi:hypothetical protein